MKSKQHGKYPVSALLQVASSMITDELKTNNKRGKYPVFSSNVLVSFRYFGTVASAMITDELKTNNKHGKYPVLSSNDFNNLVFQVFVHFNQKLLEKLYYKV